MSADNWTSCPRCAASREAKIMKERAKLEAAYGVVSVDVYLEMRESLEDLKKIKAPETVREDYEFWGFEDGEVHAQYSGRCTECDLELKFNYVKSVVWDS